MRTDSSGNPDKVDHLQYEMMVRGRSQHPLGNGFCKNHDYQEGNQAHLCRSYLVQLVVDYSKEQARMPNGAFVHIQQLTTKMRVTNSRVNETRSLVAHLLHPVAGLG